MSISAKAKIGSNVTFGEYAVIEDDVILGDNVTVGHHVIIHNGVRIGEGCVINDGANLGKRPGKASLSATTGDPREYPPLTLGKAVTVGAGCILYVGAEIDHRVFENQATHTSYYS